MSTNGAAAIAAEAAAAAVATPRSSRFAGVRRPPSLTIPFASNGERELPPHQHARQPHARQAVRRGSAQERVADSSGAWQHAPPPGHGPHGLHGPPGHGFPVSVLIMPQDAPDSMDPSMVAFTPNHGSDYTVVHGADHGAEYGAEHSMHGGGWDAATMPIAHGAHGMPADLHVDQPSPQFHLPMRNSLLDISPRSVSFSAHERSVHEDTPQQQQPQQHANQGAVDLREKRIGSSPGGPVHWDVKADPPVLRYMLRHAGGEQPLWQLLRAHLSRGIVAVTEPVLDLVQTSDGVAIIRRPQRSERCWRPHELCARGLESHFNTTDVSHITGIFPEQECAAIIKWLSVALAAHLQQCFPDVAFNVHSFTNADHRKTWLQFCQREHGRQISPAHVPPTQTAPLTDTPTVVSTGAATATATATRPMGQETKPLDGKRSSSTSAAKSSTRTFADVTRGKTAADRLGSHTNAGANGANAGTNANLEQWRQRRRQINGHRPQDMARRKLANRELQRMGGLYGKPPGVCQNQYCQTPTRQHTNGTVWDPFCAACFDMHKRDPCYSGPPPPKQGATMTQGVST